MAKPTLLLLVMAFALSAHAQNRILHQLEIKGGYLIDQDDQRIDFLTDEFGDEFRLNYQGLKYIAFGYTGAKGKNRFGLEIDYFKYGKLRPDNGNISRPIAPPGRYKRQVQLAIFYGRSIINTKKVNLYIAPLASIASRTNTLFGTPEFDVDTAVKDFVIGLGGKLQANLFLTDRFGLSLGSKLMVLDYVRRNVANSIVNSSGFDFIRGDVVLQAGFVFSINK